MIIVQDRIEVAARDRAPLQARLMKEYVPGASGRGLAFVDAWVSPPFDLVDQPITLWLRWQVADIPAWWAMRSAAGEPAVLAFWNSVAQLIVSRERRYLVGEPLAAGASGSVMRAPEASWPEPIATAPFHVTPRGWRETAQLYLLKDLHMESAPTAQKALEATLAAASHELPGVVASWIAANYVADYGAGHFTWDILFPDRESATAARKSSVWRDRIAPALASACERVCALGLETVGAGLQRPELAQGVKRTALFRALPSTPAEQLERWERDLLEMPAHVTSILNWRLSRAVPLDWSSPNASVGKRVGKNDWSHVWEQEYDRLEGLTVDYMVHPHHWAHVDRWFDPESGSQIIDTALCHAFSPLDRTILGRDARG